MCVVSKVFLFRGMNSLMIKGRELAENIQCRLDRALANGEWASIFSASHVWHLERELSDHSPIKLICEGVIESGWIGGDSLASKLILCVEGLQIWGKDKFGPAFKELKKNRKELVMFNRWFDGATGREKASLAA